MRPPLLIALLVALSATGFAIAACSSTPSTPSPAARNRHPGRAVVASKRRRAPRARTTQARAARGTALAALATLPVKGRSPRTGYSREQFGPGWLTEDGCDTRDRILRRDLTRSSTVVDRGCEVRSGHLEDPYTAVPIAFVRGDGSDVDIDHVVALGDAWQKGAQRWSPARRIAFANDPLNLLAVDAGANRRKGDGDAATWLPPNKAFRCDYVARQVAVKRKYGAWVTPAEGDAIRRVLARCPGQRVPATGRLQLPTIRAPEAAPPGRGPVFANCAAVRAAGRAPLRRGTAGYAANRGLDRDGDGLACE